MRHVFLIHLPFQKLVSLCLPTATFTAAFVTFLPLIYITTTVLTSTAAAFDTATAAAGFLVVEIRFGGFSASDSHVRRGLDFIKVAPHSRSLLQEVQQTRSSASLGRRPLFFTLSTTRFSFFALLVLCFFFRCVLVSLYEGLSVGPSFRPSVGPSVTHEINL